jgi:hypothetical protein
MEFQALIYVIYEQNLAFWDAENASQLRLNFFFFFAI